MGRRCAGIAAAVSLAIGLMAPGCTAAPPLANTQPSARAIGERLLDAIAAGDRQELERLALDEAEFRVHVWPDLPAARPERKLPVSYVWGDLRQKSETGLTQVLHQYQGRRYTLVDVRFGAAPTRYRAYTVHRNPVLVARGPDGVTEDLRLCGSLLEMDGRWKVFSYVVDD
jgi:hypothetical protein